MKIKKRSPRTGFMSGKWAKLVYKNAGILSADKPQNKSLQELWLSGYSHKDASILIGEINDK